MCSHENNKNIYKQSSAMKYGCHFENDEEEKKMYESDYNVVDHDDSDETELEETEEEEEEKKEDLKDIKYAGSKEDREWIASTNTIKIENEQRIYERLISKMGVFRWQGSQLSVYIIYQSLTNTF